MKGRIRTNGVHRDRTYSTKTFDYVKDCYFKVIRDKYEGLDFCHFEMMVNSLFEYVRECLDTYDFKKIYLQGFCYMKPQVKRIENMTRKLEEFMENNKDAFTEESRERYLNHIEKCRNFLKNHQEEQDQP